MAEFQRARSPQAKRRREESILAAARSLAASRSVRAVTLTDIADAVGMHKSAMLRYFETREQIFLTLTGQEWRDWSAEAVGLLAALDDPSPRTVAEALAHTLVGRPLFCDLLAQTPLNLEHHVSFATVREFKLLAIAASGAVAAEIRRIFGLGEVAADDVVTVAASMAGALWQMAAPHSPLADFYRREPGMAHAIVDVEPRLVRVVEMMLVGSVAR